MSIVPRKMDKLSEQEKNHLCQLDVLTVKMDNPIHDQKDGTRKIKGSQRWAQKDEDGLIRCLLYRGSWFSHKASFVGR